MLHVTICIASIGRLTLPSALLSAIESGMLANVTLDVVVADDSEFNRAEILIAAHEPWPVPIKIIPVGSRNVAIARNACLEHASGDYVAFIDDDERADLGWLTRLVRGAGEFGADAVFGRVDRIFPADTPQWIRDAVPTRKMSEPRGTYVETGSTANCLIRLPVLRALELGFDPEFGRIGAEDADLFTRMREIGLILVTTDDAIVTEHLSAEQLTETYLRRQYQRSGHTYAAMRLRRAGIVGRIRLAVSATAKWTVARVLSLGNRSCKIRAWRYEGYLSAVCGQSGPILY